LKPWASATDVVSPHNAAAEAIHPARALVLSIRTITTPLLDWTETRRDLTCPARK
jgi:hypothetical protein